MDVISLQSRVKSGYVGNAIAEPTLTVIGVNVWPVDSVLYAHHPGHGPVTPEVTGPSKLMAQLEETFARCTAPMNFLSGYLANAAQGRTALDQLHRARNAGRLGAYYLDPVFGDDAEGTYVDPSLIAFFRDEALPQCDVLMPNRYELGVLSGIDVDSPKDAIRAARALIVRGPSFVLASSIPAPDGHIANVLVTRSAAWAVTVRRRDLRAKGTGDLLSAAFTGLHTLGAEPASAMTTSVALVDAAAADAATQNIIELDIPKVLKNFNFSKYDTLGPTPIESLEQ